MGPVEVDAGQAATRCHDQGAHASGSRRT
jgi:hypothetical protein